jgi:hypothetical protein
MTEDRTHEMADTTLQDVADRAAGRAGLVVFPMESPMRVSPMNRGALIQGSGEWTRAASEGLRLTQALSGKGRGDRTAARRACRWVGLLLGAIWFIASALPCSAAEWQWSVPVAGVKVTDEGPSRAFLWIPPGCRRVRGVVVGQHNMEEEPILEHPKFRQALAELGFAEVWASPAFNGLFRFDEGAGEVFTGMMNDLAKESGYAELAEAPIVPIGHSAMASYPFYFAAWNPGRTLCAVSVSGQWPYVREKPFAPDIWGDRKIDYVPGIVTIGEYESAENRAGEGLSERVKYPLTPLSALACPAEGHFAPTDKKIEYLALYIRKAAQYRLPPEPPSSGAVKLRPIDPTKEGWLADRWHSKDGPNAPAAPVGQYAGDPRQAFWYFDEELAKATEAYQAEHRGRKGQLLGYVQDGQVVAQNPKTHQQVTLKFQPGADGVTFRLTGAFLDTVPEGRPVSWTGLKVGSPVGHAAGGGPISIDRICGPVVKVAPDTFAVRFDKVGTTNKRRSNAIWLAATHPGDDEYKPAVQQSLLNIPLRNNKGSDQQITFPAIADRPEGTGSVKLDATSDAKVPVSYYVLAGPAEVDGDTLKLTPIPPRSRYPVKVTVVAWQYGRSVEPMLKTAEPVVREFVITKAPNAGP